MALDPGHLVERVAERLRGVGGLTSPPPARRPAPASPLDDADPTRRAGNSAPGVDPAPAAPPQAGGGNADRPEDGQPDTAGAGIEPGQDARAEGETLDAASPENSAPATDTPTADADGDAADGKSGHPGLTPETMLARVVAGVPAGMARAASELTQTGQSEALAPLPPLELEALERAGLVVGRKLRTRISEEFRVTVGTIMRSLKTSYAPGRGAGNLLMVTSSRPGEGKSFTALNLAGSIAQHTQREVLLVDMDAKQHSLSDQLGLGDRPGLIDLAASTTMRIEETVVRTAIRNLSFLPVGTRRGEGSDIGEGTVARPMTALIERMGRRFPNHLVILDAPPCLSTSDPSTIASYVGQTVLVIEAEKTQKSEVLASLDLIKACQMVTLMLNKIRVTTSYTFGAYHYFGTYT